MITVGSRVRYLRDGCLYEVVKELRRGFYRCEGPALPGRQLPTVIEAHSSDLRTVSP